MLRSLPHANDVRLHAPPHLAEVVAELERFFDDSGRRATAHGPQFVELWRQLRDNTMGGKLFRPRMVAAAFDGITDAVGQPTPEPCQPSGVASVGAAFELLHAALIVHDDVIDRDFVRRGRPNIAGAYRDHARQAGLAPADADHHGMSAAVIAGDLALFYSFRLIDRARVDDRTRTRLVELIDEALFASAAGELLDVDFSGALLIPSVDNILRMSRLKTAVYSFEVPLKAGAVLAGAPDEVVEALGEFGREIGIAYQLVDDLLGVFGDADDTGKSTLGDLREGKRTVMIAYAAATDAWAQTAGPFGSPDLTEEGAQRLRAVLEQCGAREYAEQLVRDHVARARDILAHPHLPQGLRDQLGPVIDAVVGRGR